MTILFGIILFHVVILWRTQSAKGKTVPYTSVFFFTLLLVVFVAFMMLNMEKPEQ